MIPEITNLQSGGCSSCGGTCNGSGGSGCCNHIPDTNGLITIEFIDVLPRHLSRLTSRFLCPRFPRRSSLSNRNYGDKRLESLASKFISCNLISVDLYYQSSAFIISFDSLRVVFVQ